jgi:hypothetical protein
MFKTTIRFSLLAFLLLTIPGLALAEDHGWIRSVAKADPETQVYRVNIQRVNGKDPISSHRYTVEAGEATIRVSLILETQWAPKLRRVQNDIFSKEFKMKVEAGSTYVLGGKVNPDASDEEMDDGSFWNPAVVSIEKED